MLDEYWSSFDARACQGSMMLLLCLATLLTLSWFCLLIKLGGIRYSL